LLWSAGRRTTLIAQQLQNWFILADERASYGDDDYRALSRDGPRPTVLIGDVKQASGFDWRIVFQN
jgi:hypothetical protein